MATTTQTFTGTGSQTQFSIAFSYRTTADVKATINAVATTAFSVSGSTVTFTSAPANGAAVVIFRETTNDTIEADFQSGSALRAVDLNDNFEQLLFVTQESTNTANTADTNASAAVTTANTASSNATTAVNTANAATTTANSATATANSAVTTANSATATANAATTTANTASTNATAAVNTANTASSNATAAVNTANTASTNATAAVNTANTASSNATTAVNTANAATTTANAASAAVANAVLYDPVANVAAIPGSPSDGDYVEVQDSTGIQSFSPLSGMPSGFVGDSGLVVRLKYVTSPSTTWQWQNYFAKDSETRYLKDNAAQIVDADINASAAIGLSKLATGALPSGITVASANITDGTIVDADISGSAAIGLSKLATGALPTAITVTSANISDLSIVNADVNASAAIAGTKISPNFGSQNVVTTGSAGIGTTSPSSNLHIASSLATIRLEDSDVANGASYSLITSSSNGNLEFIADPDNVRSNTDIRFSLDGTERLRIDSSGNVGINSSSPEERLHVNGAIVSTSSNSTSSVGGSNRAILDLTSGGARIGHFRGTTSAGSGYLGLFVDSSERLRIDSSGDIQIGTNTAATNSKLTIRAASPHLSLYATPGSTTSQLNLGDTSDHDIGNISYSHSDNSMRFTANASERLRIDSSGNIKINGDAPYLYLSDNDNNWIRGSSSINAILFGTNNSESMRIDSSGNVFIGGTTAASADIALNANGSATFAGEVAVGNTVTSSSSVDGATVYSNGTTYISRSGANNLIVGRQTGTSGNKVLINADGSATFAGEVEVGGGVSAADGYGTRIAEGQIVFRNDNQSASNCLRILKGGDNYSTNLVTALKNDGSAYFASNVGIGTSSPGGKLSVFDSSSAVFRLETPGVIAISHTFDGSNYTINNNDGSTGHPIIFGTKTAGGESMRINSAGRLLVGTTAADQDARLTVCRTGTGGATPSTISGSTVATFRATGGLSHESHVSILGGSTGASQLNFGDRDDEDVANIRYDHNNNSMRFVTLNAERMLIDAYGRVGIGATPEAWHSNTNVLRIGAGGALQSQTTNRITELTTNIYSDGSNNRYIHTDFAAQYYQYQGAHVWTRAASGTAGNVATMQESMRIDTSGRVGIGTTSPSTLLHLSGSADTYLTLEAGATDGNDGILFKNSAGTQKGALLYDTDDNYLLFNVNESERMRIDGSGRVGIGNTTMSSFTGNSSDNLVVGGGSGSEGITVYSAAQGSLTFADGTSGNAAYRGAVEYNHTADQLAFRTAGTGNRMVIDSSGDVAIGNSNPITSGGFRTLTIGDGSSTGGQLHLENSSGGNFNIWHATTGVNYYAATAVPQIFHTNGSERMRIDSSGNVGIGKSSNLFYRLTFAEGSGDASRIGWVSGSGNRKASIDCGNTAAIVFRTDVSDTERMRIDSSGRLLLGTTTEGAPDADNLTIADSGDCGITIRTGTTSTGAIYFSDATSGSGEADGFIDYNQSSRYLRFGTAQAERMRVTSAGYLCVNRTDHVHGGQLSLDYTNGVTAGIALKDTQTTGTGVPMQIVNGAGSVVGSITQNQSSTSFNTSSDYRLKENVIDIADGIARVKQLQPKRFNFIADADTTVDGFLAHEAQTVVPEAVTGTHNEVDDDGNAVMQGIDQSKLVPLLTAALQEAIAKIETLEAKVAALEAA